MKIAIVCYASVGGSGVVATELAMALAGRGHDIHLISSEPPFRWREGVRGLTLHRVEIPAYPLFREPQYLLALANTIAHVADREQLDIVHAHYAVPHATAAFLADQMLASADRSCQTKTVTTLHGTDVTLVGSDPSYAWVVGFSIERSHGVTAVSESLRRDTVAALGVRRPIDVIPNFLDCAIYRRQTDKTLRDAVSAGGTAKVITHMSNFRPIKRLDIVLDVFTRVRRQVPARLVLVGDGPVRAEIDAEVRARDLAGHVTFAGEAPDPVRWLSVSDVFLLPSAQESFGLAALEAMACEVPVISSTAGGLTEIVQDGITGYACALDDVAGMSERAVELLRDDTRRRAIGRTAAAMVRERYCTERVVPLYEEAYRRARIG